MRKRFVLIILFIFIIYFVFLKKDKEIYTIISPEKSNNYDSYVKDVCFDDNNRNIFSRYPYIEYEKARPWRRFDSLKY